MNDDLKEKYDHYDVLEVTPEDSSDTVKKSYKRISLLVHPDKNLAGNAMQAFQRLNEAFEILGDESKRDRYVRPVRPEHGSVKKKFWDAWIWEESTVQKEAREREAEEALKDEIKGRRQEQYRQIRKWKKISPNEYLRLLQTWKIRESQLAEDKKRKEDAVHDSGKNLRVHEEKHESKLELLINLYRICYRSRSYEWNGNETRNEELRMLASGHPKLRKIQSQKNANSENTKNNVAALTNWGLRINEEAAVLERAKVAARVKVAKNALEFLEDRCEQDKVDPKHRERVAHVGFPFEYLLLFSTFRNC